MNCKKHPDQNLHPGICSSCLREKLSNIPHDPSIVWSSSRNRSTRVRAYSFSPSPSSSVSPSACASPGRKKGGHVRSESLTDSGLRKSRSLIAFASRKTRGVGKMMMIKGKGKNKKDGFWSKLIGGNNIKKTDHQAGVFMHSRTTVEDRF